MNANDEFARQQTRFALPLAGPLQENSAPGPRTEFGVTRSTCACKLCRFPCKVIPGFLIPADLNRLIPSGEDPFAWARLHLRASPSLSLVPARKAPGGPCHWLTDDERCAVHQDSPFGCAFFQCFPAQSHAEAHRLAVAGIQVILEDRQQNGLYSRIWDTLWAEGLRADGSAEGKASMEDYAAKLQRQAETKKARADKKKVREQKKSKRRR